MPIYEFYCPDCHMVFNFFSHRVNTSKHPNCPKCQRPDLQKEVSVFAAIRGGSGNSDSEGMDDLPISESKMESVMETLAREAEGIDENDPRQEAQLMRRFSEMTGIEYGEQMNEAIRRLEAGEDMETIEQEMGDALDGEDLPFVMPGSSGGGLKARPPARDETLYDL